MTLDKARNCMVQVGFGGFYNANSAKLIRECGLDAVFGFESGSLFRFAL